MSDELSQTELNAMEAEILAIEREIPIYGRQRVQINVGLARRLYDGYVRMLAEGPADVTRLNEQLKEEKAVLEDVQRIADELDGRNRRLEREIEGLKVIK
jgi:hypothetical protein